jgi:xylulokinase
MFLGIDLGTSSIKFVLLDEKQNIIAQTSQSLSVSQPRPLWSEQDPHEWRKALHRGVFELKSLKNKEFSAIKAIGLSGQQHGAVLLNSAGGILRPAMLWNDGRAFKECELLANRVPHHTEVIGNRIMPGFTAPKVVWVAQHEPDIFKQIFKIVLPKDYLRFVLTGEYATDVSDAAGTAWLNVRSRAWSNEMLAASHVTEKNMPVLFEGSDITGKVSKYISDEWGISSDTVVVGGGGDNPSGAISMNVIKPGSAFLSLGTSGVYFVSSRHYRANPSDGLHTFCHCLPHYWHTMSVHLSAASSLIWLSGILNEPNVEKLIAEVECSAAQKNNVIFLPYLSGERTPHINVHAQGVLFGMRHSTSRSDLTRAVLEGVAFAFADGQDAIQNAGIDINDVAVVGGGAQSDYWGGILASVLQRPLIYRHNRDVGAALGAAKLAWLALHPCDPEKAFSTPAVEKIIQPDPAQSDYYVEKRQLFRKLYQRVEDLFHYEKIF